MLDQVNILLSRRAYEFRADDLRLTALSTKPVQDQIQQIFQFQTAVMGQPMSTFGDVPATYPPGFVFDMGTWLTPDKRFAPIRFLHFEQRRIVIDVAGPSSAIDGIFEHLLHFLSPLQAADGAPIIGKPERVLDFSEITFHSSFPLDALFAPPLRTLFNKTLNINGEATLVPTFVVQAHSKSQELASITSPGDSRSFTFTLRAGTKPEEQIFCSSAPLDSEAHLAYLSELETILYSHD